MQHTFNPQHRDSLSYYVLVSCPESSRGFWLLVAGDGWVAVVALCSWHVLGAIWMVQSWSKMASVKIPYIKSNTHRIISHHCHLPVRLRHHYVHWSLCINPLQVAQYTATFHSPLDIISVLFSSKECTVHRQNHAKRQWPQISYFKSNTEVFSSTIGH